ncbi:hypothetical protein CFU_1418 [Collimonas fungivorans Ter331]|uniref:DUF3142 domain-containing protein n=1 Tax=Collimonas fungivorans (strain Ter331) TaxID=1005048 RepID=G0AJN5_COLFT|nr:hypothetical protein CFU_1418 [Collimonas fungivorans Ter331]
MPFLPGASRQPHSILKVILSTIYFLSKPASRLGLKHCLSCLLLLAGSSALLAKTEPAKPAAAEAAPAFASRQAALSALPPLMLWVGERPDDVRAWISGSARQATLKGGADNQPAPSIQEQRMGVAVLDTTILLRDGSASVRRRQQPLQLPPAWYAQNRVQQKAPLVTIVHIDMARGARKPQLNEKQKKIIVNAVVAAAARSPSQVVQLDFEVMHSQKPFLADVVKRSRDALPANVALSITALASWCVGDAWLADLPADEVVPIAFRMSGDAGRMRDVLNQEGRFPRPECQPSLGLSLDEQPWPNKLRSQRLYLFNRNAWSGTPMAGWAVRLGAIFP